MSMAKKTAMMMNSIEPSYQQFGVEDGEGTAQEGEVLFHVVPENGKAAQWNHIEDLDSFFTRVYNYQQRHGFKCMVLQDIFGLMQFVFVVSLPIFLLTAVDYPVLFKDKAINGTNTTKVTLADVILPPEKWIANFDALIWSVVIVAFLFWVLRLIKFIYNLFHYWDVKLFFNTALNISDDDLENIPWHEIKKRLCEVQLEQQMCIHKKELTELDIYHRILRFQNYKVAMVNKSLLPPRFKPPFIGEIVYYSHNLDYIMDQIIYSGPLSIFEDRYRLREDYKKQAKRIELADVLKRNILSIAIFYSVLSPFMFLKQIIFSFFTYAELLKREPGTLGVRTWSLYGRYYLRHFNELDHELNGRLNRAYRPATKYLDSFTSPILTVIAKNIVFVSGACFAVLFALSVYDEDVLTVEHVLTAMTVLGAIVASFRQLIPDEHLVIWPEYLMNCVLGQVHYLPSHWRGNAHTQTVRSEFTHYFPLKATYLVSEMLSPFITPILLLTHIRPRALEFVDFFRNFTVEVEGVGDVCSFAQMDIRVHGNPDWNPLAKKPTVNQCTQAEEGKTELSLAHFSKTNPDWTPPSESGGFISGLREGVRQLLQDPGLSHSSMSTGQIGPFDSFILQNSHLRGRSVLTNVSRAEGPINDINFLNGAGLVPSLGASVFGNELISGHPTENAVMDMTLSALYLHQVHQRGIERKGGMRQPNVTNAAGGERMPLLSSPSRFS